MPHDSKDMVNFHQDVTENDRLGQVLCEGMSIEAEVLVLRLRVEEEQIGQSLLGEEPFKIPHVGVADAGGTALEHVEPSDLSCLTLLMDLEELANADRQGETFAAGGVLQALVELSSVQRNDRAGVKPEPACCHGKRLGVVGREVRKVDSDPRVRESHGLAVRSDDTASSGKPAGNEWPRAGVLRLSIIVNDVQERFQSCLHSGIGRMRVDLQNKIRL